MNNVSKRIDSVTRYSTKEQNSLTERCGQSHQLSDTNWWLRNVVTNKDLHGLSKIYTTFQCLQTRNISVMSPPFVALGSSTSFFAFSSHEIASSVLASSGICAASKSMRRSKGIPYCFAFGTESFFLSYLEPKTGKSLFKGTSNPDLSLIMLC